jgi:hypothetical protein
LQRIGRTSIATRWRSCGLPQSASCSENFVIPPDVFGQTLIGTLISLAVGTSVAILVTNALTASTKRTEFFLAFTKRYNDVLVAAHDLDGRSWPSAFGMYCRRDGRARYAHRWTRACRSSILRSRSAS